MSVVAGDQLYQDAMPYNLGKLPLKIEFLCLYCSNCSKEGNFMLNTAKADMMQST